MSNNKKQNKRSTYYFLIKKVNKLHDQFRKDLLHSIRTNKL
jgi:hypothetical protein